MNEQEKTLDTTALSVGMIAKNYKELCNLLSAPVMSGTAKKAQLKEWARYFEFEKLKGKQSYIILDIYETPLDKDDGRSAGNNNIYTKYIELILINYLSKQKGNTCTFTRRNWWHLLGMINERYNKISNKELQSISHTLTDWEINHFYQRSSRKLDSILTSALRNLRNRRLIEWQTQTVIVNADYKYYVATDDEIENILKIERKILRDYGADDVRQLYYQNRHREYYRDVNSVIYEKLGYRRYYKRIKIIYNQENMIEALPDEEINMQKLLLNNEVATYLSKESGRIYDKWVNRYNDGLTDIFPYVYLKAQSLLIDELIRPAKADVSINQFIEMANKEELDEEMELFNVPLD